MIEKKIICSSCGKEHIVKLKEDYADGDFMTVCPETGEGVYVVMEE